MSIVFLVAVDLLQFKHSWTTDTKRKKVPFYVPRPIKQPKIQECIYDTRFCSCLCVIMPSISLSRDVNHPVRKFCTKCVLCITDKSRINAKLKLSNALGFKSEASYELLVMYEMAHSYILCIHSNYIELWASDKSCFSCISYYS